MKPFSLTTVLRYRKQLEDEAALNLTQAYSRVDNAQKNLQEVADEINKLQTQLLKIQQVGISIEELRRYENHFSLLKRKRADLTQLYDKAVENLEKSKVNVIDKRKEKKAIERLQEIQNTQWDKHQLKKENSQLDETAVLFHKKNQT